MGQKLWNQQTVNIITYCFTSILVMIMLSVIITAAQQGYWFNQDETREAQIMNLVNERYSTINNSDIKDYSQISRLANNYSTTYAPTNVFDPLSNALSWMSGAGKAFAFPIATLGNVVILSTYAAGIGGLLGFFLEVIILAWQISVLIQMLRFMFPNRI